MIEFPDIPIENFESTCRVCLTQSENLICIHEIVFTHSQNDGQSQDILLSEVFQKYCNVLVYQNDQKPQNICEVCMQLVAKAFNIFEAFCESNELLDQILEKNGSDLGTENMPPNETEFISFPFSDIKEEDDDKNYDNDSNNENSKIFPKVHLEQLSDETDENKEEFCYRVVVDPGTDCQESKANIVDSETEDSNLQNFKEYNEIDMDNTEEFVSSKDLDRQDAEVEPASKKLRLQIPSGVVNLPNVGREKWDHTYYVKETTFMKVLQGSIMRQKPMLRIPRSSELISKCNNKRRSLPYGSENDSFNCKFCEGLILQGMDEVIEHMKEVHPSDDECILCPKKFSKTKVLLNHVLSHADKNDLLCTKCHIYFKDKESLETHYESEDHLKNTSTVCKTCQKDFKHEFFFKRHMREVHLDEEQGVCPKCGLFIKFRSSLERHLLKHREKTSFLCEHCSKGFLTPGALKKHILIEHEGEVSSKYSLDTGKNKEGKKQRDQKPRSKLSDKGKNNDELFACEYCPDTFGTRSTFFRHRISHPECRGVPCPFCDKVLDTPEDYKDHRATVHSDYICDICQKGWPSKTYLDQHRYNTHRSRLYRCSVCPKSFKFSQSLKQHETTHTDVKPFSCHYCDKRFRQRTHVVQHETCMHMKSKKHRCNICEKTFNYNSGLKAHLRSHMGLKPFSCPYCGKSYTDTVGRHKHVKSTHPEKMDDFIMFKKKNQSDEARLADLMPHTTKTLKNDWMSLKASTTVEDELDEKKECSDYETEEDSLKDGLNPSGESQELYTFMDVMDENSSEHNSDNSMKE